MNNVALRPQHLDILSICTGGAGLDLGIELAIESARTVCMVEREAFAVAHLVAAMQQGLLAECPVWSNARTFDGRPWRGLVDGLIGGIPCQPHSLAGRKRGSLDERDLWSTARRIIVQSRCWFVLIENVGGMLAAGDDEVAGAERVWRDLRKLGFQVEGGLFAAAEVGASHERERIFILAVADGSRDGQHRRSERDRVALRSEQQTPWRHNAHGCCLDVVDTPRDGRREGRAEPEFRSGRDAAAGTDSAMADADIVELRREPPARQLEVDERHAGLGIFPPGPSDLAGWRSVLERAPELEPAFRRVADGLASRLDIGRVDRLRMLGNGVVPLQAAHAFRTLCHRLAGRGSAGAARLVRMMGEA